MTGEESVVILIEALEAMGIPYMLAGSFSSKVFSTGTTSAAGRKSMEPATA